MADQIDVSQVIAQVEYVEPPQIQVSHLFVQVEYVVGTEGGGDEPGLFFANG